MLTGIIVAVLIFLAALSFFCNFPVVTAQPTFITDAASTTPKRMCQFEFSNEFDWLQRSACPAVQQNTADFELAYGLFEDVEISVAAPWLTIFTAGVTTPRTLTGIGDMRDRKSVV